MCWPVAASGFTHARDTRLSWLASAFSLRNSLPHTTHCQSTSSCSSSDSPPLSAAGSDAVTQSGSFHSAAAGNSGQRSRGIRVARHTLSPHKPNSAPGCRDAAWFRVEGSPAAARAALSSLRFRSTSASRAARLAASSACSFRSKPVNELNELHGVNESHNSLVPVSPGDSPGPAEAIRRELW